MEYSALSELRSRIWPLIRDLDGVNGTGIGDGCVRIYVRTSETLAEVRQALNGIAGDFDIIVSGDFVAY